MDLATLDVDRMEARQAFLDYRRAVRDRHDDEDAQIMRGYREIARGRQLVDLGRTVAAGGVNDAGQPRLAVADAHQQWAWLEQQGDGRVGYLPDEGFRLAHNRRKGVYRFPAGTLPVHDDVERVKVGHRYRLRCRDCNAWICETSGSHLRAMVPKVPPALRPAHHLRNYTILWEVDRWQRRPDPPGDPALLKHIGGMLYAVLAVWNLTDLERAVLAARNETR